MSKTIKYSSISDLLPRQYDKYEIPLSRDDNSVIRRYEEVSKSDDIKRKYAGLIEALSYPETCIQCGNTYKRTDNLLSRSCKIHTGKLRPNGISSKYEVWTCCGRDVSDKGCVSCLHISNPEKLKELKEKDFCLTTELPKELLDSGLLKFSPEIVDDYPVGSFSKKVQTFLSSSSSSSSTLTSLPELFYNINIVALYPPNFSYHFF